MKSFLAKFLPKSVQDEVLDRDPLEKDDLDDEIREQEDDVAMLVDDEALQLDSSVEAGSSQEVTDIREQLAKSSEDAWAKSTRDAYIG